MFLVLKDLKYFGHLTPKWGFLHCYLSWVKIILNVFVVVVVFVFLVEKHLFHSEIFLFNTKRRMGVTIMTKKYLNAGYPIGFIKSVISDFKKKDENQPIIHDWLFEERSKALYKMPYWPSNEHDVKRFIEWIESPSGGKIMLTVLWSTKNIKPLFRLKDKVVDPTKHFLEYASHKFIWKVLSTAPSHFRRRNILEAFFNALWALEHQSLSLFRQLKVTLLILRHNYWFIDCLLNRVISLMSLLNLLLYFIAMKK